jgi:hypothetical protein
LIFVMGLLILYSFMITHHRFHFTLCRVARKNTWERCNAWTGAKDKCRKTCKVCS